MEKTFEVKVYKTAFYCNNCNSEVFPSGETCAIRGFAYKHKCTWCGASYMLDKKYPVITYEKIED